MEFDHFIRREIDGLVKFSGVLVGDRQLAHDVLTDALIIASRKWRRIERLEHPTAYVRRIVVTSFLADRRTAARRRTFPTADLSDIDSVAAEFTSAIDERSALADPLRRLPPQQRAAVVLRFYLDHSDAEIAVALGCSPATVRTHISHAMATLRAARPIPSTE